MNPIPRLVPGALIGVFCAASAFAQGALQSDNASTPKSRAEVQADLRDWVAAGYDTRDWVNYPQNALRAGRIVAHQRAQAPGSGSGAPVPQ